MYNYFFEENDLIHNSASVSTVLVCLQT